MTFKIIGHHFYVTPSFVHHFVVIGKFKLKLQSRSKWDVFFSFVIWKFERWPWKIIGNNLYTFKFCAFLLSHRLIESGVTVRKHQVWVKIRIFVVPCDPEFWWMTAKNNKAPFPFFFKLCAYFFSHSWIQTGVTVRKHQIQVKINDFFCPCDLEIWWNELETQ